MLTLLFCIQKFNSGLRKKDSPPYESGTNYRGGVPIELEFTPLQLVEQVGRKLGKKLGAVIDLTFTFRYYNSQVWHSYVSNSHCGD